MQLSVNQSEAAGGAGHRACDSRRRGGSDAVSAMSPIAVYVHTPFCPSKCGYCDFNSYAMSGEIMERTTNAICQEIGRSPIRGRPAKTIFFGGGTPTFLETGQLLRILETVLQTHPPIEGCEITSEANPGTVDAAKFADMRRAGFNRVSLGAQSFLEDDLITLGRVHRVGEIERAVASARQAGFDNLNLDLMFALPNQSHRAWESNLQRAIDLQPEHLSLYCLTIEPNTAFHKLAHKGILPLPGEDQQAEMYDQTLAGVQADGYELYEISNYAKPGRECRHNLCYWHGEEYAGYGPGAVGAIEIAGTRRRHTNLKHPDRYCAAVEGGEEIAFEVEELTPEILRTERIMLGLRLAEGIPADSVHAPRKLFERGWIEEVDGRLKLTPLGRHFHNEVVVELL
jgi:oxygen-independent coproporphyrinogen III oxidase